MPFRFLFVGFNGSFKLLLPFQRGFFFCQNALLFLFNQLSKRLAVHSDVNTKLLSALWYDDDQKFISKRE
ncbi:hypothetical protein Hanom_Chr12g01090821 [Helianthus anomalus]